MKLTTFFSLLSAALSIVVSCYTIIHFMDNSENKDTDIQEVDSGRNENTTENTIDYQRLNEDGQNDIHQGIYRYIKQSREEEKKERKKEKSRSKMISFLIKSLSLLINYLIIALVIAFFIKDKKEYIKKIVQKDIVPQEIKKIFLLCYRRSGSSSENLNKEKALSLFEKNVLFDLSDRFSQSFFIEIICVIYGFHLFTDLSEPLISIFFALFKDRKKSLSRRWEEVFSSLNEDLFNQLPFFRTIKWILVNFINILGFYFMFRMTVYSVDRYNNAAHEMKVGGGK